MISDEVLQISNIFWERYTRYVHKEYKRFLEKIMDMKRTVRVGERGII